MVAIKACWLFAMQQVDVRLLEFSCYQGLLYFDVSINFVFARLLLNLLTIPNASTKWLCVYVHINYRRLEDHYGFNPPPTEGRSWFNDALVNLCLHEHVASIWCCVICQEVKGPCGGVLKSTCWSHNLIRCYPKSTSQSLLYFGHVGWAQWLWLVGCYRW